MTDYCQNIEHQGHYITDVLRSGRERYLLVRLLSYWTYTVRPDCDVPVDIVSSVIWSAAGFGPRTNPVPPLRCCPAAAGEASWTSSTLLCRRHSDLQVLRPVGC